MILPTASVFISHATPDRDVATRVCAFIEQHGYRCWLAYRDALAGELYATAIMRAINAAEVIVLVLSAQAVSSAHVGREVERGCSKGRRVVALRIDASPLNLALEYFLSECHWLDASESPLHAVLPRLLDCLGPSGGQSRAPNDDDEDGIILRALWKSLDPALKDAFAIAYNKKQTNGSRRISTRDFFQALQRIDDPSIHHVLGQLPENAMPDSGGFDLDPTPPSTGESPLLSSCVSESLHRFGALTVLSRPLGAADIFLDIAKYGKGASVHQLRQCGVDERRLDEIVEASNLPLIRPYPLGGGAQY